MLLKVGDIAKFKTHKGDIIKGEVAWIFNDVYFVVADGGKLCVMYSYGLFRFKDQDIVK